MPSDNFFQGVKFPDRTFNCETESWLKILIIRSISCWLNFGFGRHLDFHSKRLFSGKARFLLSKSFLLRILVRQKKRRCLSGLGLFRSFRVSKSKKELCKGTDQRGTRFIPRNIYSPKIIRWINAEHFSDRQQIARMPIARKTWRLLELTQWHIHRIYYTPAHWSKGKASAFFDRKKIRP